ncbi:MAG: hypothetical protein KJ579_06470 [Verrucomicrobia bacterium]|nr:hypothetical protein [Verrucomicrobiota bacterium]
MGFKIPGPKAAALGQFKAQCEAWVDAFARDDEEECGQIRKAIREQPDSLQRRLALAYVDKKEKLGIKPKLEPEPYVPTPEETMRVAVEMLAKSRKPFAEAIMDGVREQRVGEDVLVEIRSLCEAAVAALRRRDELRSLLQVPDSIQ